VDIFSLGKMESAFELMRKDDMMNVRMWECRKEPKKRVGFASLLIKQIDGRALISRRPHLLRSKYIYYFPHRANKTSSGQLQKELSTCVCVCVSVGAVCVFAGGTRGGFTRPCVCVSGRVEERNKTRAI
jgi:hypothetical protein